MQRRYSDFEKLSGKKGRLIDLRWLNDIDAEALISAVGSASKVLVVEECRKRGSTAEEVVTMLAENRSNGPIIKVHAASESPIALGPGAADGLPSRESICEDLKLWWQL